jgi:hypothetical protein
VSALASPPSALPGRIELVDSWYVVYVVLQGVERRVGRFMRLEHAEIALKRFGTVPDGYYGNTALKGAALRGAKAKARRALGPKTSSTSSASSTSSEDGKS